MSIQKRTVTVTKEQEMDVTVCDNCGGERVEGQQGWMSMRLPYTFTDLHWCSYACLAEWAEKQQITVDALQY